MAKLTPRPARRTTIDKAAAHRFVVAAIPASQRQSVQGPANANAALAARQAAEYDVGRASRFKHVATENVERIVPGESGDGDVEMLEGDVSAGGDSDASAAELLLSVDAEIEADAAGAGEEVVIEEVKASRGSRRTSGKRKRAEDLA